MEPPTTDAGPRPGPLPPPSAPPGGWPGPRQLRRRPEDGHVAGVCAGVAEYFNVDPVIVRIAAVVLLVSGPGAFAYILAWTFVPAADPSEVHANRGPIDRKDRGTQILGIVLLALALSVLWGDSWSPARRWFFPLALIAIGTWLLLRHDQGNEELTDEELTDEELTDEVVVGPFAPATPPTPAWGSASPEATDAPPPPEEPVDSAGVGGAPPSSPWDLAGPPPIPPVPPLPSTTTSRRRRLLGPIVFGALLIWGGLAWLFGVSVQNGLAVGLCLTGVGFVLGAFVGGSRALILPAIVVGAALALTALIDIPLSGPIGQQAWAPVRLADVQERYEVSVGEGLLDLSAIEVAGGERLSIEASVGVGQLVVVVPEDTALDITTSVGGGESLVLGVPQNGLGVSTQQFVEDGATGGTLVLDLEVGVGQIEVTRDPTAAKRSLD